MIKLIKQALLKKLAEEEREAEEAPGVKCYCECTDCEYNEDMYCVAEEIELKYSNRDDGELICECVTYSPVEEEPEA